MLDVLTWYSASGVMRPRRAGVAQLECGDDAKTIERRKTKQVFNY